MPGLREFGKTFTNTADVEAQQFRHDYVRLISTTGNVPLKYRNDLGDEFTLRPGVGITLNGKAKSWRLENLQTGTVAWVLALGDGAKIDDDRQGLGGAADVVHENWANVNNGVVAVNQNGTLATVVNVTTNGKPRYILMRNTGTVPLLVGGTGITDANGMPLEPGEPFQTPPTGGNWRVRVQGSPGVDGELRYLVVQP